jgi:head-tail adaptor
MARLERLHRKRRRVPIGDLDTRIFVEDRVQAAPAFGFTDAAMDFSAHPQATMIWAKVETGSGRTLFDGVETDRKITHEVSFRRLSGVTAETWLRLQDGTRLDILEVEDLDVRGEFQMALCEATGLNTRAAASR